MFCKKCGTEMLPGDRFCVACGEAAPETVKEAPPEALPQQLPSPKPRTKVPIRRGTAIIFIIGLVGVIAVYFTQSALHNKAVEAFSTQVGAYETTLSQQDIGERQAPYEALLSQAKGILAEKNTRQMEDLAQKLTLAQTELLALGKLTALQRTSAEKVAKYDISDVYKGQYAAFSQELETALQNANASSVTDIVASFDALDTALLQDNQSRIAALQEKISAVDLAKAGEADKIILNNFSTGLATQLDEGDYKEALATLEAWHAFALAVKIDDEKEEKPVETTTTVKTIIVPQTAYETPFIIPESSTRYLMVGDLAYLSNYELMLARNEIFARHGRLFDNPDLQQYFNQKSWYYGSIPPESFSADMLNKYEKANVDFIKSYE